MSSFCHVLLSRWIIHSGTYCVRIDESCVPAKIAWAICSPEETCNYRTIGAAHTTELDQDEDDKPVVCPGRTAVSEDEDDKPLVQPPSRKELVEEKRESAAERSIPTPLQRRQGPPVWRDPSATLEKDVSRNSRDRLEEVSILDKNPDREALHNIIKNSLMNEIWGTFTWNITICLLRSSRRGQLTWTLLEKFLIFSSMWWRRVHSAIRRNRDLTDHAWADYERKNLEIWSSWTMDQPKIGCKTFGFLFLLGGATSHLRAYPCKSTSPSEVIPNFMTGWTLSRWIRRRSVQMWLSIIHMTCRHSIECIMWRDFQLDRTLLGHI